MSKPTIFNQESGIILKETEEILNEKKDLLKEKGISLSKNRIFDIINYPSSEIDRQILVALSELFKRIDEGGSFFKEWEAKLSIPSSSTFDAVRKAFLQIDGVDYCNLTSGAGIVALFLIITNKSYFINGEANQLDTKIKNQIWEVFYKVMPSGTAFIGDITVDGLNEMRQKKTYKFSLGKPKYIYMKIYYKINHKDFIHIDIDTKLREIYKQIIDENYKDMGIDYVYQDFLAPVSMIKGIKSIRVGTLVKEDEASESKSIQESEYTFNTDIEINPNEILLFDTKERLLIDIDKE
ncbi:hypothetical protein DB313_05605 (plasmid) [Borrelia turcica IST7]|uniref:DUF276 domain-containing protein n=1 Tax=Borrelia turcica IST7 TaxID=1104446 RepID=A0A386PNA1_9SPIR|nr:DUF276 domain-containing protein [Borrelia turcica]AYE36974.1 hypothetical protein DB313_05605 [Borrelia turcica IST7]